MPGDLTEGQVVHAADLNAINKVVGAGSPVTGTAPPNGVSSGWKEQGGTAIIMTNASGDGTITLPVAYAACLLTFYVRAAYPTQTVLEYGDPTAGGGLAPGLTSISFRAFAFPAGTALTSQNVRVTWGTKGA